MEKLRISRKEHTCSWCGLPIRRDEYYFDGKTKCSSYDYKENLTTMRYARWKHHPYECCFDALARKAWLA